MAQQVYEAQFSFNEEENNNCPKRPRLIGEKTVQFYHLCFKLQGNEQHEGLQWTKQWCGLMLGITTVEPTGSSSVSIKTSGHNKDHFTVILSAKGDGTKLKPFIVFRRDIREVSSQLQDIQGAAVVSS